MRLPPGLMFWVGVIAGITFCAVYLKSDELALVAVGGLLGIAIGQFLVIVFDIALRRYRRRRGSSLT